MGPSSFDVSANVSTCRYSLQKLICNKERAMLVCSRRLSGKLYQYINAYFFQKGKLPHQCEPHVINPLSVWSIQ